MKAGGMFVAAGGLFVDNGRLEVFISKRCEGEKVETETREKIE